MITKKEREKEEKETTKAHRARIRKIILLS